MGSEMCIRVGFCELGASPPSIEAAKALDAMGSVPGYRVKTGDAKGAYTQSLLRGTKTWVALPENPWPKHWRERQIMDDCAHTPIMNAQEAPICVHATKPTLLSAILVPGSPGLVPGGPLWTRKEACALQHVRPRRSEVHRRI